MYIPSINALNKIESLVQGFWIDKCDTGVAVLMIKLEASLVNSIVKGVPLEIVIRNPKIDKRSCTLYIYDIVEEPFYVTGRTFSEADKNVQDIDEILLTMASSNEVIVSLYNLDSKPIHTKTLDINCADNIHNWLFKVYNYNIYSEQGKKEISGNYLPENEFKGFSIKINNYDSTILPKIDSYLIEPDKKGDFHTSHFNLSNYEGDGKHGYFQENSVDSILRRHFIVNEDFFCSPQNSDGTEFTDFILISDSIAILIESKYVISDKQTKINNALKKAINQLNDKESQIKNRTVNLVDKLLENRLTNNMEIVKVCLINDKVILTEERSKNLSDNYEKKDLPIFIPVSNFNQMIGSFALKSTAKLCERISESLLHQYWVYLNSDRRIVYMRTFKINGEELEDYWNK